MREYLTRKQLKNLDRANKIQLFNLVNNSLLFYDEKGMDKLNKKQLKEKAEMVLAFSHHWDN